MYTSFKKAIILLLMFLVIFGISSFATKYKLIDTEISFENGVKIKLTTSKNVNSTDVLKNNNISILEHEKVEEKIQDSKRVIRIISDNSKNKIIKYRLLFNNNELINKVELSSEIKVKPIDKIVEITSNVVSRKLETPRTVEENSKIQSQVQSQSQSQEQPKANYSGNRWKYTAEELDLICAITAQESSSSYEGALAVISTAINRANSSKWRQYGRDPLSQYKGQGQFTYSIDGQYKKRLNGNYSSAVKQAVIDGLNGKTNHNYLSFRSSSHARKYGITGLTVGGNTFYSN